MRQLVVFILILMLGAAAPSAAQVYPGNALEVYDANDELVGAYLGMSIDYFGVSVALDSGEAANLIFYQQIDETDHWGPGYSEFVETDCSGTPYARSSSLSNYVLPGALGNYYQPKGAELYRFSGTASSVTINSIYYEWDGTCNAHNATGLRHAGVLVDTVSTAFPFYIKEVPASAPLLPLWAFASIAGGIVLSGGGAIVMRGRWRQ